MAGGGEEEGLLNTCCSKSCLSPNPFCLPCGKIHRERFTRLVPGLFLDPDSLASDRALSPAVLWVFFFFLTLDDFCICCPQLIPSLFSANPATLPCCALLSLLPGFNRKHLSFPGQRPHRSGAQDDTRRSSSAPQLVNFPQASVQAALNHKTECAPGLLLRPSISLRLPVPCRNSLTGIALLLI